MTSLGSIVTAIFLLGAAPAIANEGRDRLADLARTQFESGLKTGVDTYNALVQARGAEPELKKLRLTDSALETIRKEYGPNFGEKLLLAEWRDGEARISQDGITIAIGAREYAEQAIRVNDLTFSWSAKKSREQNLKDFRKFFRAAADPNARHSPLDLLIPRAYAFPDVFRLEVSGLSLFFTLSFKETLGDELSVLNEKVAAELKRCKELPLDEELSRNVVEEGVKAMAIAASMNRDTIFSALTCANVVAYAQKRTHTAQVWLKDEDGVTRLKDKRIPVSLEPQLKKELCGNIAALTRCFEAKVASPSKTQEDAGTKDTVAPPKKNIPGKAKPGGIVSPK